ncbi:hypothetical protein ABS764_14095 [Flavobacterium sp. ST-87]|uniref:Glycosyl transferases group 1 n=1 Tax=Flavobacterium plantiphilum TaxID=3163297 RepID=A0ABW8XWE6_9FLAO
MMKSKVYVYGLCNVFYDAYYIKGLNEVIGKVNFNISKFPLFKQGTFAVIIENTNSVKKIIIDSGDSNEIDLMNLQWCDVYGKINYDKTVWQHGEMAKKIISIGPGFGIKIWNLFKTLFYMGVNFYKFKTHISNKRDFVANYWRQYKRLYISKYYPEVSSKNEVFFISSIWRKEKDTNDYRALFIECCKENRKVVFEGGFASRTDGNNLGYDNLVTSAKIPLKVYVKKIKKSAIVFNTPAVLSCHGWKLAEFLALGKAIITTPHFNELPADLLNYEHLIYANNKETIQKAIDELITDENLKKQIQIAGREYFEEYLAPEAVIKKILRH